ncbi:MAG: hypothetical protein U9P49_13645 [Thermodesulfobacteriota bacterium]|nr:hypothetical protein [Thermodesulfobacteriota bacterium]
MDNKFIKVSLLSVSFTLLLMGCAGNLTFIPRGAGDVIQGSYSDGMGQTTIKMSLPSGEMFQGKLIWIPPRSVMSSGIATIGSTPIMATGMSSGNTGMYMGTVVGDRGTKMKIQLLCNAWTGKCIGVGVTSDGTEYDIQR